MLMVMTIIYYTVSGQSVDLTMEWTFDCNDYREMTFVIGIMISWGSSSFTGSRNQRTRMMCSLTRPLPRFLPLLAVSLLLPLLPLLPLLLLAGVAVVAVVVIVNVAVGGGRGWCWGRHWRVLSGAFLSLDWSMLCRSFMIIVQSSLCWIFHIIRIIVVL